MSWELVMHFGELSLPTNMTQGVMNSWSLAGTYLGDACPVPVG